MKKPLSATNAVLLEWNRKKTKAMHGQNYLQHQLPHVGWWVGGVLTIGNGIDPFSWGLWKSVVGFHYNPPSPLHWRLTPGNKVADHVEARGIRWQRVWVEGDEKCSRYAFAVRPVCTACKWVVMGVGWGRGIGYTLFLGSVGFGFWRLTQSRWIKEAIVFPVLLVSGDWCWRIYRGTPLKIAYVQWKPGEPHKLTLLCTTVLLFFFTCVTCISSSGFR